MQVGSITINMCFICQLKESITHLGKSASILIDNLSLQCPYCYSPFFPPYVKQRNPSSTFYLVGLNASLSLLDYALLSTQCYHELVILTPISLLQLGNLTPRYSTCLWHGSNGGKLSRIGHLCGDRLNPLVLELVGS